MGRPKGSKNKAKDDDTAGPAFYIELNVPKFNIEFEAGGKPKSLIQFPIVGMDSVIEIRPEKGRTFGDNAEDGTPCLITADEYKQAATYFDKSSYAYILAEGTKQNVEVQEEAGEGSSKVRTRTVRRAKARR